MKYRVGDYAIMKPKVSYFGVQDVDYGFKYSFPKGGNITPEMSYACNRAVKVKEVHDDYYIMEGFENCKFTDDMLIDNFKARDKILYDGQMLYITQKISETTFEVQKRTLHISDLIFVLRSVNWG